MSTDTPVKTYSALLVRQVFAILLGAASKAVAELFKALSPSSPGGVSVTEEEAKGILVEALQHAAIEIERKTGLDFFDILAKAGNGKNGFFAKLALLADESGEDAEPEATPESIVDKTVATAESAAELGKAIVDFIGSLDKKSPLQQELAAKAEAAVKVAKRAPRKAKRAKTVPSLAKYLMEADYALQELRKMHARLGLGDDEPDEELL